MTRSTFLKSLGALPLACPFFIKTVKPDLERDYYTAVRALILYRDKMGLNPGVRVWARGCGDPPRLGVIAPYGRQWETASHTEVPVLLEGYCQPWNMFNLEIAG